MHRAAGCWSHPSSLPFSSSIPRACLSLALFPYQTTRTSALARGPGVPHPLSIARSPLITRILLLPLSSLISRCSFLFTLCRVFCSAFPHSLPFLSADQRTFLLSIVYTHSSRTLGLDYSDFLWTSLLSHLSLAPFELTEAITLAHR